MTRCFWRSLESILYTGGALDPIPDWLKLRYFRVELWVKFANQSDIAGTPHNWSDPDGTAPNWFAGSDDLFRPPQQQQVTLWGCQGWKDDVVGLACWWWCIQVGVVVVGTNVASPSIVRGSVECATISKEETNRYSRCWGAGYSRATSIT